MSKHNSFFPFLEYLFFSILVTKPNEQEFVFFRILKGYSRYQLTEDIEVEFKSDNIYFAPYESIK
jgi:hypothetical protein